jgi:hypothetical protein
MLSVGKLAHLARMQEGGDADDAVSVDGTFVRLLFALTRLTECRPALHDNLDFISA